MKKYNILVEFKDNLVAILMDLLMYDLEQLKDDILNNELFGFIEVDIKTPLHLEQHFEDMPPIFKNKLIKLVE